jgi:selenocysteine-specific elongation factor
MKAGFGRSAAASAWGKKLSPRLVHAVTERLIKQGKLAVEGDILRLPEFSVSLASDQSALRAAVLAAHLQAGAAPPNMKDVLESLNVQARDAAPILKIMQDAGELVRVADGIWYAAAPLADIQNRVRGWFTDHDNLDLGGLKEITGLSRKYLIALMEYFDKERLTIRVGDRRVLRGK